MKRNLVVLCVLVCFCAFTTGVYAQPAPAEEPVVSTNIPPDVAITAAMGAVMSAEIDGISTDVQVSELDVGVEIPFVDFGYKLRHYEWDNVQNGALGITSDPFSDLHKFSLDLQDTRIVYNEQWGYTARASITSSFEQEMGNSFAYEGELGLAYEYDENFMITAGAIYHWDETDYWVIPACTIRYRAFADEGLSIVLGTIDTYPEAYAEYRFENGIGVKLGWSTEKDVYRLGNRNDYNPRGHIETWDQIAELGASWAINENIKLAGGLTYNFDRDYKSFTEGGNRNFKMDIDNAFGMNGGIVITF